MTTTAIATYQCPACRRSYAADRPLWRCDCGSHLNLATGPGLRRDEIAVGEASLWRYAAALSLRNPPRISLGEGWTPLVRRDWQGAGVCFKLESQMPTGSFKDRGTAVMINHLLEVGVDAIHEDFPRFPRNPRGLRRRGFLEAPAFPEESSSTQSTRIPRETRVPRSQPTPRPPAFPAVSTFRPRHRAASWCRSPLRGPMSGRSPAPGRQ